MSGRRRWSKGPRVARSVSTPTDESRSSRTCRLWVDGRCRFVGDAKYKRIEPYGYKNADLYQLLAYCVATDLQRGTLVYAAGEGEPFSYEVVNLGRTLEVVTLDLGGTPSAVLAQVEPSQTASAVQLRRRGQLEPRMASMTAR